MMISETTNPRIKIVLATMKSKLHRQLNLKEMAVAMNISSSRLCHIFKNELGMSPVQLLKLIKLQEAKRLLETTFLNIKEIMLKVGIKDESHFIRNFKGVYGLPPIRYREFYLRSAEAQYESRSGQHKQN